MECDGWYGTNLGEKFYIEKRKSIGDIAHRSGQK